MAIARIGIVDNKKKNTPAKTIGEATKEIAAKKKKKKAVIPKTVTVIPKIVPTGNAATNIVETDGQRRLRLAGEEQAEIARRNAAKEEKVVLGEFFPQQNQTTIATRSSVPTESIEDIINRMREEKRRESQAARQAEVAQGTSLLQGSLQGTQGELARQTQSLDPRFGALKGSAVAGTQIAQNTLANLLPFSGQQSGRGFRQAQGLETGLQGRQSELDAARTAEEQDIAFRGQQAVDQFNTGRTALEQGATAAEIARNVQAGDFANAALLDEATLARDRLLESEAQANADLISGGEATLNLAFDKWNAGIALNEAEAVALGVPTGSTKPRTVSSGGGSSSGLSDSALATNARFKISNGQPLTAEEARVFGVQEGYVDPNFTTQSTPKGAFFPDETVNSELNTYIQQKGGNVKQSAIEFLVNQGRNISEEQGNAIQDRYGITDLELSRIFNAAASSSR